MGDGGVLSRTGNRQLCVMLFSTENRVMGRSDASEAVVCDGERKSEKILNGYVDHEMLDAQIDQYIVAPALGENPGILGAMCLGILERKTTFNMGEKMKMRIWFLRITILI